jgi:hypothetical protein
VTRRATLLVAAILLLAFPGVAHAGFDPRLTVADTGGDPFGYPPDVGFSQSGSEVVETVSAGSVEAYVRPPGGTFTHTTLGSGTRASLAVSANGAAVVAWKASATSVKVAYRPNASTAFNTSAAGFTGTTVGNVAAGIDPNGNAVVAWKDGGIHYALSNGASFGTAQDAPLGTSPGFDGRTGNDPQRDHGPQAFRDDAGNVSLVFLNGSDATVAHRPPAGSWDSAVLPGGAATEVHADADPVSHRLMAGYAAAGMFRAYEGSTTTSAGRVVVTQPSSSQNIFSVAVRRGGVEDMALWRGQDNALHSAACMDGFAPATVASSAGSGAVAALTTGGTQVAYFAAAGLGRASRAPGGAWVREPDFSTNNGGYGVAADYAGGASMVFVEYPTSGGPIRAFPFSGPATGARACSGAGNPPPGGKPPPPPECNDPTTLLVKCAATTPLPGICGPSGTIFPACHLPVDLPVVCGPGTILQACNSKGPAIVACGGFGTILPQCNTPPAKVPQICGAKDSGLPACTGANNTVTVCGPSSGAVVPACAFKSQITGPVLDASSDSGEIDLLASCPDKSSAAAGRVHAAAMVPGGTSCGKKTKGDFTLLDVREAKLKTLNETANGLTMAFLAIGPAAGKDYTDDQLRALARLNISAFLNRANSLAVQYLPLPGKDGRVSLHGSRESATDFLGSRAGPPTYHGPAELYQNADVSYATGAFATVLWASAVEYARIAQTAQAGFVLRRPTVGAAAAAKTKVKAPRVFRHRFVLRRGQRKARFRIHLPHKVVRRLVKAAGKRACFVPVRVIVSFKGKPRPVARFRDFAIPIRRGFAHGRSCRRRHAHR